MASLLRELYRRCSQLRASADENDCDFDVQIASLNVLIVIAGSYFEQGEEYSTLSRGYDEIEEEDDEDFDEDDDDGEYYFEDEMEDNAVGTLPGGFKIGDDIWSDHPVKNTKSDDVTTSENNISVDNDGTYLSSYLRKRTAEGSAEEGEAEEGEEI
jgi:Survival motor neuron (SMN) interacting protein 1 (SIP1)